MNRSTTVVLSLVAGALSAAAQGTSPRLTIINGCKDPVWIFYQVGAGGGTLNAPNQKKLANGESIAYQIPDIGLAGTRFWPGMGCDSTGNNCQIGQSGGPAGSGFTCPATIGCAPAIDSKFEGTFGCLSSVSPQSSCQTNPSGQGNLPNTDGWDTSMVDGFTLPFKVAVTGTCANGPTNNLIDCSQMKFSYCPTTENLSTNGQFPTLSSVNLNLTALNWKSISGCFSPCGKLTDVQWQSAPNPPFTGTTFLPGAPQAQMYCCPTPPISSGACSAGPVATTQYVSAVHAHCPQTYAYAYDDAVGNFTCNAGTVYEVTFFCPN